MIEGDIMMIPRHELLIIESLEDFDPLHVATFITSNADQFNLYGVPQSIGSGIVEVLGVDLNTGIKLDLLLDGYELRVPLQPSGDNSVEIVRGAVERFKNAFMKAQLFPVASVEVSEDWNW